MREKNRQCFQKIKKKTILSDEKYYNVLARVYSNIDKKKKLYIIPKNITMCISYCNFRSFKFLSYLKTNAWQWIFKYKVSNNDVYKRVCTDSPAIRIIGCRYVKTFSIR